jgi:hypothetical protein
LPPFTLGGISNQELIRSSLEIMAWSDDFFEDDLTVSCLKLAELIEDMADGAKSQVESRRLSLPAKNNPNRKRVW